MPKHLLTHAGRAQMWQKLSLPIVFVAIVIGVVGIGWGISTAHDTKVLTQELIVSGNRHHAQTSAQNAAITQLLKEHSTDFAEQQASQNAAKAYDGDVYAFAQTIEGELAALCLATNAPCPSLPPLPEPSS